MYVALTGAATGIGAEVAKQLKAEGHRVCVFDINDPGPDVDQWIALDLNDPASIDAALAGVDGPFDALINNAGLPPKPGQAAKVLNVNFLGLRRFLDGMLDKMAPGGSIVNTASRAGAAWRENLEQVKALLAVGEASGLPGFIKAHDIDDVRAYNLSKEAVIVLTMALTEPLVTKGLRINSVSPAAVSTGILDDFVSAFGEKVAQNIKRAGRPGTPEEVSKVIVFLASPASAWLKGVDIVVDGGMSAMAQCDMLGIK